MKDTITPIRQTCHCGHDISSHFDTKDNCLVMGCTCRAYVNEDDERPRDTDRVPSLLQRSAIKARPHADLNCKCAACRRWRAAVYGW